MIVAVGYVIYAQNVCHALIRFNRYFAIERPFTTLNLNRGKERMVVVVVALPAPIPGVSPRTFSQMKIIETTNG
ncbi:hypothetical protein AAVH_19247 [Aphelenchoides avenae]|nr:hypothetical protein AAVH_19247 [Aphelenchus avenae]